MKTLEGQVAAAITPDATLPGVLHSRGSTREPPTVQSPPSSQRKRTHLPHN